MDIETFRSSSYLTRAEDIRKNPNCKTMVPCFLQRGSSSQQLPKFEKGKAMIPKGLPFGVAMHSLMKKNLPTLHPSEALFYFIHIYKGDEATPEKQVIQPRSDELCVSVYDNCKSDDGFLYITYVGESAFGF